MACDLWLVDFDAFSLFTVIQDSLLVIVLFRAIID